MKDWQGVKHPDAPLADKKAKIFLQMARRPVRLKSAVFDCGEGGRVHLWRDDGRETPSDDEAHG